MQNGIRSRRDPQFEGGIEQRPGERVRQDLEASTPIHLSGEDFFQSFVDQIFDGRDDQRFLGRKMMQLRTPRDACAAGNLLRAGPCVAQLDQRFDGGVEEAPTHRRCTFGLGTAYFRIGSGLGHKITVEPKRKTVQADFKS